MKRLEFNGWMISAMMCAAMLTTACTSNDDSSDSSTDNYVWTTDGGLKACDHLVFDDNVIGNGDQEFVFNGKQTISKGTYTLKGWVYVASGAELTIEPGTIIKGDKLTQAALIVEPGAKIYAQGTASAPIVFTSAQEAGSRKPGDWGGLIICGNATNNQGTMQIEGGPRTKHGGSDDTDNSGILSYVRVEFAGYPFQTDKEINGITFGSVGSGTQVDHIQVSYSNDDSYEWFGGKVNCKYLVAYKGWDDDFDTDNGFSGNVQFGMAMRDPKLADQSQSNGFESDNCADGAAVSPYTSCVFSNMTFIGPIGQDDSFQNNSDYINGGSVYPNNGSSLGKFQAAMHIRRNSNLSCFNSVAVGYPIGLIIDNEKGDCRTAANDGKLNIQNVCMAGMGILGSDYNKQYTDNLITIYSPVTFDESQESFSSTWFKKQTGNTQCSISDLLLADGASAGAAFMPQTGSPLLTGASFTNSLLSSWFTQVSYIGAFAAGDSWLSGWTNFDPQNTVY